MLNPLSTLQGLPAKAFVDVGGLRGVDPADGLTAALTETISYSPGDDITVQAPLDQSVDTVLSMTFVGLSGTGYIFEVGGASTGASAGFQANGDFEIVAGADPCRLVVPAADAPFGTGELTIELTVSGSIRAWWRSITGVLTELHELGTITDAIGTDWTGTGPGRYLGPDGYWDGAVKIGSSIVDTQTVTYTSAGGLRVYAGQTVSIFARGTAPAVADGQSFTVGDAITSIDGSASGANLVFSYAASGLPAGVTIDASTGAVTGLPATAGSGTATITATDQFGRQYTDTFTWTSAALPVGIPPNVADGQVVVVFVSVDIDGSAGGDGLTFTYTLTGVAGTMTINANTGQITGTVFNLNAGFGGTATITATDQHGREFTDTFTWTREAAPVISGVPTISGTETQGETLTATAASVTGLPTPSTTWQWKRSGSPITGATSASYTQGADDVGETLTAVQTAENIHGTVTAESAATGTIVADWTPADLFASGEEGGWWDIHPDYLFQNSNGTGAVTVGDPVGYVTDRSGNGNHATQSTSSARPVLRQSGALYYLEFDGVDDFLETASIDFSGSDEMSLFGAFEKASEADADILLEFSASFSQNDGSFYLVGNELSGTADWSSAARGDDNANPDQVAASDDAQPSKSVLSGLHDISADTSILRVNGAQVDEATGDKGVGNFGNYPLYIGARAGISIFFDGNMYGVVARGTSSTSQEISDVESYMADKSGVTL